MSDGVTPVSRSRRVTRITLGVTVLLIFTFIWVWFAPGKPIPLIISRDTTYLTEPLRPDGTIDYVAAINTKLSEGVTPENNAALVLAETWDFQGDEERKDDTCAILGVPVERVGRATLFELAPPEAPGIPADWKWGDPLPQLDPKAYEQVRICSDEPWRAAEFPELAAWVEENATVLDVWERLALRTRLFVPVVESSTHPGTIITAMPHGCSVHDMASLMATRAMWRLGEGDVQSAVDDALRLISIGRLFRQGSWFDQHNAGISSERWGWKIVSVIAGASQASDADLRALLARLDANPPLHNAQESLRECFRLVILDSVVHFPSEDLVSADHTSRFLLDARDAWSADPNRIAQRINSFFESVDQAWTVPSPTQRLVAIREIGQTHDALPVPVSWRGINQFKVYLVPPGWRRQLHTDRGAHALLWMMRAWPRKLVETEADNAMREGIARVAVALSLYRRQHGALPDNLGVLDRSLLATPPIDAFTGTELQYRKKADGYVLYSVGINRADDGGNESNDIVVRIGTSSP